MAAEPVEDEGTGRKIDELINPDGEDDENDDLGELDDDEIVDDDEVKG